MSQSTSIATIIVTHGGEFHADDVFSGAVLSALAPEAEVVRTRDEECLSSATSENGPIVFDVGGDYDATLRNFDHHQEDGAGTRPNGVPYSSFGLIWQYYGRLYLVKVLGSELNLDYSDLHKMVDEDLVQGIDSIDTGAVVNPYFQPQIKDNEVSVDVSTVSKAVFAMNPQPLLGDQDYDSEYLQAVAVAQSLLQGVVKACAAKLLGKTLIKSGRRFTDRIVVVEENVPEWWKIVSDPDSGFSEALYYLEPDQSTPGAWMIWLVRKTPDTFEGRKSLPAAWAGKRGGELDQITGLTGCVFVHPGRFVGGAKDLDTAIAMAKLAIEIED